MNKEITPNTPLGDTNKILSQEPISKIGDITKQVDNAKIAAMQNIPTYYDSFYVDGSKLKDYKGNAFVMRGVNNPHIWNEVQSYNALMTISSYGANSVRIVWGTKGNAYLLNQILQRCKQLKLVAIVELHDVTCSKDPKRLYQMADYFAQKDVSAALKMYSQCSLINIANEWGDKGLSNREWYTSYTTAITIIRNAGLNNPIIIDASGCGQKSSPIKEYGRALLEQDPCKNILFSIHMYGDWNDSKKIGKELQSIKNIGLCVIVGEFGYNYNNGNNNLQCKVDAYEIMKQSQLKNIGYLAWSWTYNDEKNKWLDLVKEEDWKTLTWWGEQVFNTQYGIKNTSKQASIFLK